MKLLAETTEPSTAIDLEYVGSEEPKRLFMNRALVIEVRTRDGGTLRTGIFPNEFSSDISQEHADQLAADAARSKLEVFSHTQHNYC